MPKTIIVSNRLPVKIINENNTFQIKVSEGGLATGLGSIYKQDQNLWIGWSGINVENSSDEEEISSLLKKENLSPVFLNEEEILNYYEGFSNAMLWPIFHYMSTYAEYEQIYWDYYKQVNEKFRDAVLKVAEEGDIIWIHDYQLLLLPQLLRDQLPNCTIGFFQHIPFPSYELFRLIPWRSELLTGMLGANLIGFHTFDDVRHFTSAVSRILPVHCAANIIQQEDRKITADAFPMGIDTLKFKQLTTNPLVQLEKKEYEESFGNTKVILCIDRLDYSKGIIQRLYAYEKVLIDHPEYFEKITLHMIIVPSRDNIPQYKQLRDDIDKLVGNINARFRTTNWNPIKYFYRSFSIETLSALYTRADICLVTPMRDGMNLVSKEYIASRTKMNGVLVLSEMAGASKELTEALIVNPNNLGEMYRAIIEAIEMPEEEQALRMQSLYTIIEKFDIYHWVKLFMSQLQEVKHQESLGYAKSINVDIKSNIIEQYRSAHKKLFLLDYDGTLVDFKSNIEAASPDEELYEILNKLIKNQNTRVLIISGRNHETLEQWFGHLDLDMIAEHGAWTKFDGAAWKDSPLLSNNWKSNIKPILELYVDRTPGSFIEEKKYSLVWHYRKVEKGLGKLRASDLENNLSYLTREMTLQILPGNKVLEIKNAEINKGKAALNYLINRKFDFIMAMGDDHTDEDTFKALPSEAITIKIGSSISEASFYIKSVQEVRLFLKSFINL
jgi:trehalose 6-phosphate synthase/phosphatase